MLGKARDGDLNIKIENQKTLKIVRVSSKKYWDQKSCEKIASKVFLDDKIDIFPESNATENNTIVKY